MKVNKKLSELGIEIPSLELLQTREKIAKQVSPTKKSEKKKQKLEQKVVEKETITLAGKKHKLETSEDGNKNIANKSVKEDKNANKKQKFETKSESAVHEIKKIVPDINAQAPEKKKKVPVETNESPSDAKKKIGTPGKELKQSNVNSSSSTPKVISTPLPVQKLKKPEITTPATTPKQPEQTKTPKQSAQTPIPDSGKTPKQSNPTPKLDPKKNKTPQSSKSPATIKSAHLDLSVLLGGGTPKINTPKQKEVKVKKN